MIVTMTRMTTILYMLLVLCWTHPPSRRSWCSYGSGSSFLFLFFCVHLVGAEEFNNQLMPRITERLNDFFNLPVSIVKQYVNTMELGYITTTTTSSTNNATKTRITKDRNTMFQDLYGISLTVQQTYFEALRISVALAFETGMYVNFGHYEQSVNYRYREPGNAGYLTKNIELEQFNDPNYKFYKACFNTTDGTKLDCIMEVGEEYIECVNDCELIPCPVNSNNTKETNKTVDDEPTILCRNYEVKAVQENETRGYVPSVSLCTNSYGIPEQREGHIVTNIRTKEAGTCYYGDGTTVVNTSSYNANYFACYQNGDYLPFPETRSTDGTKNCNTTYIGAYDQRQYDPRYRGWYIWMRDNLHPRWSEPFFYVGDIYLSIAYEAPLFSTLIDSDDDDDGDQQQRSSERQKLNERKVFEGNVGADYELSQIATFLKEEYYNTTIQVLIVETIEPNYIIATSYHDIQHQVKAVLIEDPTRPCPDPRLQQYLDDPDEIGGELLYDDVNCDVGRIPLSDMKTSLNKRDIVSYRAFMEHKKQNFPAESIVHCKSSDDIGSSAFVSQGYTYTLPQSDNTTTWHVLAILPMERSTSDAALPGSPAFTAVLLIGSVGFVGCSVLFIQFYSRRKERAMVQADWRFTCAFILGCIAMNLSTFTLVGSNTDPTCMLRMWSFNGCFACALSPLFVKVWRMATLLNASRGFKRSTISNCQAILYTLPLIGTQLLILLVFSLVDPPRQTEELGVGVGIGVQEITCQQDTNAFYITQLIFDGFLVFVGCVLAYKTRNLDPKYGEAKQLGFSMYNIAFTGIVTIATTQMIELDQPSRMLLQAVGVFWASFFCSLSFVLPRLLEVEHNKGHASGSSSVSGISGLDASLHRQNNDKINHHRRSGGTANDVSETDTSLGPFEIAGLGAIIEQASVSESPAGNTTTSYQQQLLSNNKKDEEIAGIVPEATTIKRSNQDISCGEKNCVAHENTKHLESGNGDDTSSYSALVSDFVYNQAPKIVAAVSTTTIDDGNKKGK